MGGLYKNYLWNILGFMLPGIAVIYYIPIANRSFGAELFSIISISWLAIMYFSIFDFGLNKALIQRLSSLTVGDTLFYENIVANLIINSLIACFGVAILVLFGDQLAEGIYKEKVQFKDEVEFLFQLCSIFLLPILLTSSLRSVLESQHKFPQVNVGKAAGLSAMYVFPVYAYFFTGSFTLSLAFIFVAKIIQLLLYLYICIDLKIISRRLFIIPRKIVFISMLTFGGWLAICLLMGSLIVYMDKFFLAKVFDFREIALYNISFEATSKLVFISTSMSLILFPILSSKLESTNHKKELKKQANIFLILVNLLLLILFIYFGESLFKLWLSEDYTEQHFKIALTLMFGVFFNSLSQIYVASMIANRRERTLIKIYLVEIIIYVSALFFILEYTSSLLYLALVWSSRAFFDYILILLVDKNEA